MDSTASYIALAVFAIGMLAIMLFALLKTDESKEQERNAEKERLKQIKKDRKTAARTEHKKQQAESLEQKRQEWQRKEKERQSKRQAGTTQTPELEEYKKTHGY